jgi:uncharacterized Zn finger protein
VPREGAPEKGRRLLTEGRLSVEEIRPDGTIVAHCRGDSGEVYALGYDAAKRQWRCTCAEMKGRCSHLVALQLVTVRRAP